MGIIRCQSKNRSSIKRKHPENKIRKTSKRGCHQISKEGVLTRSKPSTWKTRAHACSCFLSWTCPDRIALPEVLESRRHSSLNRKSQPVFPSSQAACVRVKKNPDIIRCQSKNRSSIERKHPENKIRKTSKSGCHQISKNFKFSSTKLKIVASENQANHSSGNNCDFIIREYIKQPNLISECIKTYDNGKISFHYYSKGKYAPNECLEIDCETEDWLDERLMCHILEYLSLDRSGKFLRPRLVISENVFRGLNPPERTSKLGNILSLLLLFLHYGEPFRSLTVDIPGFVLDHKTFQYLQEMNTTLSEKGKMVSQDPSFQLIYNGQEDGEFITASNSQFTKIAPKSCCFVDTNSVPREDVKFKWFCVLDILKKTDCIYVFIRRHNFFKDFPSRLLTLLAANQQWSNKNKFEVLTNPNILQLPLPGRSEDPQLGRNCVRSMSDGDARIFLSDLISTQEDSTQDMQSATCSNSENATSHNLAKLVTILCDIENPGDLQTARRLESILIERQILVNMRISAYKSSNVSLPEQLNDTKRFLKNIESSQLIIALISPSFLQSGDCLLDYTLALCYHAASQMQKLLSFIVSEESLHEVDNMSEMFKKEKLHIMRDRTINQPVYFSFTAMTYLVKRAIKVDRSVISVKNDWFPSNKIQGEEFLNLVDPCPSQRGIRPRILLPCYDDQDDESIRRILSDLESDRRARTWFTNEEHLQKKGSLTNSLNTLKNDEVMIFCFITNSFIQNEERMNHVYELFMNLHRQFLLRIVFVNGVENTFSFPTFLKSIPAIKVNTKNNTEEHYSVKIIKWLKDDRTNPQGSVFMKPPNSFRQEHFTHEFDFPHSDDENN